MKSNGYYSSNVLQFRLDIIIIRAAGYKYGQRVFAASVFYIHVRTVYDRIDATATINFSTQFGAATIRERRLFESGVYSFGVGTG